jgi:AraC-like DNA-binding protein
VQRVAERIAGDPAMLTVEHVSRVLGIGPRSLQRLFRTYVGAGPKWMIRLYRIKEAAARIEEGNLVDWADLAGQLGYADQSHFINDFRRLVGRSPGEYAVGRRHDG